MKKIYIIFTFFIFSFTSLNAAQLKVITHKNVVIKNKSTLTSPAYMTMLPNGNFALLLQYINRIEIKILNSNVKILNQISIDNSLLDMISISFKPTIDNGLFIEGFKKNQNYTNLKSNSDEPFAYRRLIHLDNDLKIINNLTIHSMGTILPVYENQKFYYLFGHLIHTQNGPMTMSDDKYYLKVTNNGTIFDRPIMTPILNTYMIQQIATNTINIYDEDKLITIANRDLFIKRTKPFNAYELPNKFNIYFIDHKKNTILKSTNLTEQIINYISKYSKTIDRRLLHIWSQYYIPKSKLLIFSITQYNKKTTCSKKEKNFLALYNLQTNKLHMAYLRQKYINTAFIGVHRGINYFWDYKDNNIYGMIYIK